MSIDVIHMTSLFESATEGIILTDEEGKIVVANPAAERIFHYKQEELVGKKIEILLPDRIRVPHQKMRKDFYESPQNRVMGHGRDLYARTKEGEEIPVEVSLSHYRQAGKLYVIAFIIDITIRKRTEEEMKKQQEVLANLTAELRKLNIELEGKVEERTVILREALMKLEESQAELSEALGKERELNEIKSRFVSMASHEFRTPLSTILSSASLLSRYTLTEQQENRDKHINRIKDSVKSLNEILEDFLSLGRLNEGKVLIRLDEFDLNELIKETLDELKGLLKAGQHFDHEGNRGLTVKADRNLLKNILINLISNASKFSPEGALIVIESYSENGNTIIKVKDKGIGISEEDQEHLFSSFFRGKNAMNIQGTGLGLHIVKRYINLLAGEVELNSELNEGTTVVLKIPNQ